MTTSGGTGAGGPSIAPPATPGAKPAAAPEQGYRACLGIMRLGRRYGDSRHEPSARALALGSCRFHTVRNILTAGQDRLPLEPPAEMNPTPTHSNIRGADYYAATTEDRC